MRVLSLTPPLQSSLTRLIVSPCLATTIAPPTSRFENSKSSSPKSRFSPSQRPVSAQPRSRDHCPRPLMRRLWHIACSAFERDRRHGENARTPEEDVSRRSCIARFDRAVHVCLRHSSIAPGSETDTVGKPLSAPLYRSNLNWSVVPKPQKAEHATTAIIDWILEHHQGETGIIYCLVSLLPGGSIWRSKGSD